MKRCAVVVGVVLLGSLVVLSGCSCGEKKPATTTRTEVDGQSYLLRAEDFDLETVMGLMKEDKVKSAEELEKAINGDSGINNVDIDRDEKIDYVSVRESRDGEALLFDFVAIPSSTEKEDEAETVASVKFTRSAKASDVKVEGGYPSHVQGHHHHYYSYHHPGVSLGQALFLTWLFMPRPLFYAPYPMGYYAPRPVYSRAALSSQRSSYRASTSVGPVQKSTRPASFNPASAQKAPSKWRQKATAQGGSLSSKAGASKGFEARDASKEKKKATGFGAKKSTSGSVWGGSSKSSGSNVWGGKSSSGSSTRGKGFGSSSGSKKSSGWGSSASGSKKKSSWGSSSRSRSSGRRR